MQLEADKSDASFVVTLILILRCVRSSLASNVLFSPEDIYICPQEVRTPLVGLRNEIWMRMLPTTSNSKSFVTPVQLFTCRTVTSAERAWRFETELRVNKLISNQFRHELFQFV